MLTSLGIQIERHWREHRPKMVDRLERRGLLEQAVYAAQELTAAAEAEAIYGGMNPDQARELTREEWAFLPTEEDVSSLPNGDPAEWLAPPSPEATAAVSVPSPKKFAQ